MYMYVQLLPLLHSMLATVATVASIAMALYIYYTTIQFIRSIHTWYMYNDLLVILTFPPYIIDLGWCNLL